MEEHRLPVLKTLKFALKDVAGIIMKMPVLCMTVMLVFLIIKIYKPSRDIFRTEGFTIWNISEFYFYFALIVAVRAIFALPAYRLLIDGEDRMQRNFRESIEAALAYCAAYVIFKILPLFALRILVSPMLITNSLAFLFFYVVVMIIVVPFCVFWYIRWSLILPAIAVDWQGVSLRWTNWLTEGAVWRIYLSKLLLFAIFSLCFKVPALMVWSFGFDWCVIFIVAVSSTIILIADVALESEIYIWCRDKKSIVLAGVETPSRI